MGMWFFFLQLPELFFCAVWVCLDSNDSLVALKFHLFYWILLWWTRWINRYFTVDIFWLLRLNHNSDVWRLRISEKDLNDKNPSKFYTQNHCTIQIKLKRINSQQGEYKTFDLYLLDEQPAILDCVEKTVWKEKSRKRECCRFESKKKTKTNSHHNTEIHKRFVYKREWTSIRISFDLHVYECCVYACVCIWFLFSTRSAHTTIWCSHFVRLFISIYIPHFTLHIFARYTRARTHL